MSFPKRVSMNQLNEIILGFFFAGAEQIPVKERL